MNGDTPHSIVPTAARVSGRDVGIGGESFATAVREIHELERAEHRGAATTVEQRRDIETRTRRALEQIEHPSRDWLDAAPDAPGMPDVKVVSRLGQCASGAGTPP